LKLIFVALFILVWLFVVVMSANEVIKTQVSLKVFISNGALINHIGKKRHFGHIGLDFIVVKPNFGCICFVSQGSVVGKFTF
jgi:hypothetical protein